MVLEYRIGWAASSNATFRGFTDWERWDEEDVTSEHVEDALCKSDGAGFMAPGFAEAMNGSGFEWWVETREADEKGEINGEQ